MTYPLSLHKDFWEQFTFTEEDLEFLYNYLLEEETPKTPGELLHASITERISREIHSLQSTQKSRGQVFLPKESYMVGQQLLFPALNWQQGTVTAVRDGVNPEIPNFQVIQVAMEAGDSRQFASGLADHALNQPVELDLDDPNLKADNVIDNYGRRLEESLTSLLEQSPDLVQIAGSWFPRALLVDVNIGYMNLAEALLDMEGGGPLPTTAILEQIELPTDTNLKLTEFSLNLALQEDGRFDEVGPYNEVLWYLRRLEPESVQNIPVQLRYRQPSTPVVVDEAMQKAVAGIADELSSEYDPYQKNETAEITLIYPHWRAGTLPLSSQVSGIFPTAIESPRVQLTMVDGNTNESFSAWVVRQERYVYGLGDWYNKHGVMPGSIIRIRKGPQPGEVTVMIEKKRQSREWVRTALVGADGGLVFALLKQIVSTSLDDRMAIAIPDSAGIDRLWEANDRKTTLENIIKNVMNELAKLSPQGHVHAHELYAAVNLIRRCPPTVILDILLSNSWATHLGDLYFRMVDPSTKGGA